MARHSKPKATTHPGRLTAFTSVRSATGDSRPPSSACRTTTAIRAATADALVQATTPSASEFVPMITFTAPLLEPKTTTADAVKDQVNKLIASFSPEISEAVQSFKSIGDLPIVETWELVPAPLAVRRGMRKSTQQPVVEKFDGDLGSRSSSRLLRGNSSQQDDGGGVVRARDSAVELAALGGHGMVETDYQSEDASEIVEFFASLVGSDGKVGDKRVSLGAFR
ncbi:hypothetical protein Tdes44962_MAKER00507 [Teratosphaeria destructans]|uniref:Uncharacterized protein n=1 Tax=Teratosphaeria destructans TaxID=418781 RepID=A0A9W7SQL6_9PEZI|nr:hypothetical protein Tdes44962_MAKER00507 [Teratosphaeria destructans]